MSTRAYRLLRNNEEQGPFTMDELIQKNLKPSDLIWVNGLSTGWNYPGEMAEFKPYAPISSGQDANLQYNKQHTLISASMQAAVAINDNIAQSPIKQQKPKYKVSAAWSKIQTITAPVYQNILADKPQKPSPKKNYRSNTTWKFAIEIFKLGRSMAGLGERKKNLFHQLQNR